MVLRAGNHRRLIAAVVIGVFALAGCTGSSSKSGKGSVATLTVHIGLFGGPARPGGGMALSNNPAQGENVTAVDAGGRKSVARTDADGIATMRLAVGRYTVFSTYCGTGPHHLMLTEHRTTRVQIDCPIP